MVINNYCTIPSLDDKICFLHMLQGIVDYSQPPFPPPFLLMHEPNFLLLLRLQQENLINMKNFPSTERNVANLCKSSSPSKGRRKRKRVGWPCKNNEKVERQRITHIAVERNRRRLMNEHLDALRSFMPPPYIQRGDQASIIGGAIDFVKELEQLLQSLQAQKRMRQGDQDHPQNRNVSASSTNSTSSPSSSNFIMSNMLTTSSPSSSTLQSRNYNSNEEHQLCASTVADNIEVVMIQNHVNLKIQCQRKPGKLIKAAVALEQLRLSILHLNITSFHDSVLYSFNLKIEDGCKLGSADEVASAVHQILSFINIY